MIISNKIRYWPKDLAILLLEMHSAVCLHKSNSTFMVTFFELFKTLEIQKTVLGISRVLTLSINTDEGILWIHKKEEGDSVWTQTELQVKKESKTVFLFRQRHLLCCCLKSLWFFIIVHQQVNNAHYEKHMMHLSFLLRMHRGTAACFFINL